MWGWQPKMWKRKSTWSFSFSCLAPSAREREAGEGANETEYRFSVAFVRLFVRFIRIVLNENVNDRIWIFSMISPSSRLCSTCFMVILTNSLLFFRLLLLLCLFLLLLLYHYYRPIHRIRRLPPLSVPPESKKQKQSEKFGIQYISLSRINYFHRQQS